MIMAILIILPTMLENIVKVFISEIIHSYMNMETEETKSEFIIIKVSPREKEMLRSRAASFHLSLSRFMVMMSVRGEVK